MENVEVTDNYFVNNSLDNYSVVGFKNDQIRRAPGAGGEITRILNSLQVLPVLARTDKTLW